VGIPVPLLMMERKPADIVSFIVLIGAGMFLLLEEIASSLLGDLISLQRIDNSY
jgi:hypothetical protein